MSTLDIIHCQGCCHIDRREKFPEAPNGDRSCPKCGMSIADGRLDFLFFHDKEEGGHVFLLLPQGEFTRNDHADIVVLGGVVPEHPALPLFQPDTDRALSYGVIVDQKALAGEVEPGPPAPRRLASFYLNDGAHRRSADCEPVTFGVALIR